MLCLLGGCYAILRYYLLCHSSRYAISDLMFCLLIVKVNGNTVSPDKVYDALAFHRETIGCSNTKNH